MILLIGVFKQNIQYVLLQVIQFGHINYKVKYVSLLQVGINTEIV